MAEELELIAGASKTDLQDSLLPQVRSLIKDEPDLVANLANVAAVLKEAFDYFWVGFYMWKEPDGELVLGPFQGPLACTRIGLGMGVCGAAASQKQTMHVPDVEAFPGHIACSSESKSEIVVPILANGAVKGVLDVDSDVLDDFDADDVRFLEQVVAAIVAEHWPQS